MRRATGLILQVLGLLLVLAAVLWWVFAPGLLILIPEDVDTTIDYEGVLTYYIGPFTIEVLPPGEETTIPMRVQLKLLSENDEYDSDTAVISGSVESEIGGVKMDPAPFVIVLNRKTCMNEADDRAYFIDEDIVVDRSGNLSYTFPFNTSKDEPYHIWKEEVAGAIQVEFTGEGKNGGLTVYGFSGSFEGREAFMPYIESLGFPTTMNAEQFKGLLAGMGVDIEGLLAQAGQRLSPEDAQAFSQALDQGVALKYYWSAEVDYSVEPVSGILVDVNRDWEKVTVKPDTAALASLSSILMKYQQDPVLGPELQKLASLAPVLDEYKGQSVMEYEIAQTEDAVIRSVDDAEKGRKAIAFVKMWIPLFMLVMGIALVLVGVLLLRPGSGKEAGVQSHGPREPGA